ncbi:MAG: extradiol ring-cleavage dioxygenase [Nitrospinota bacterium]
MSVSALNRLVHDLQFPDLREAYRTDPGKCLAGYDLTDEEIAAVRRPDIRALWLLGVNPYLLRFFQHWNHVTDDEFRAALEGLSFLGSSIEGMHRG